MARRIDAVDVARAVALIGMMVTHVGPRWTGRNPPIGDLLAGGRAAPLFAMLAGVALTLVHRRDPHGTGSVRATLVRAALLVALGLWLGSLDDMPVLIILAFYGVLIVLALPFRDLPTRTLVVLSAVWAVTSGVVVVAVKVAEPRPDYVQLGLADLRRPLALADELVVHGTYPVLVWLTYVLVGLVVGRLDLRSRVVAMRLVGLGGVLVASTVPAPISTSPTARVDDPRAEGWRLLFRQSSGPVGWDELLRVGQHTSTPLNVVSATGSALLVIGVCALVVQVPWTRAPLQPLRAAGAMTLTLYTLHVLWFWRWATDESAVEPFVPGYGEWLLQVVVLVAFAALWQRFVGRGPLESFVRFWSVTVWRRRHKKNAPA